jgi:hypothetical protein
MSSSRSPRSEIMEMTENFFVVLQRPKDGLFACAPRSDAIRDSANLVKFRYHERLTRAKNLYNHLFSLSCASCITAAALSTSLLCHTAHLFSSVYTRACEDIVCGSGPHNYIAETLMQMKSQRIRVYILQLAVTKRVHNITNEHVYSPKGRKYTI